MRGIAGGRVGSAMDGTSGFILFELGGKWVRLVNSSNSLSWVHSPSFWRFGVANRGFVVGDEARIWPADDCRFHCSAGGQAPRGQVL